MAAAQLFPGIFLGGRIVRNMAILWKQHPPISPLLLFLLFLEKLSLTLNETFKKIPRMNSHIQTLQYGNNTCAVVSVSQQRNTVKIIFLPKRLRFGGQGKRRKKMVSDYDRQDAREFFPHRTKVKEEEADTRNLRNFLLQLFVGKWVGGGRRDGQRQR